MHQKLGRAQIVDTAPLCILIDGELWFATVGNVPGEYSVSGNWLRDGEPELAVATAGDYWLNYSPYQDAAGEWHVGKKAAAGDRAAHRSDRFPTVGQVRKALNTASV